MDAVFPLIKRYGGVVIGLRSMRTESRQPQTEESVWQERIIEEAKKYGIDKKTS